MMYKYLHNSQSSTNIDEKLKISINERLKKRGIYSDFIEFGSEKELASILAEMKKQTTNTLVIVGDDNDFNILMGQIGKLDSEIAIGYLPIAKSRLSKKFKLNSWQDAVEALAQRRIKEKTLYSISSRYFYDLIELDFDKSANSEPINIKTDKNLELKLPKCKLRFENLNEDRYFSKTPIQLIAYHPKPENQMNTKTPLLNKIINKIKNDEESDIGELILSLHSKNFKAESHTAAIDSLGRKFNQSFGIGKTTKTIRFISKRPDRQK